MDKNVYSIEEIFAGRIFSIPDYQRGYAWEKEHCLDLLDDLDQLPPGFNHYTGTVVFHAKGEELLDNEGSKYHVFDIVDGQQRLTSLVILLDSVHRSFSGLTGYATLASGIEKKYIKGIRLVDNMPFQKLTLNADCSNYFRTDILGAGGITGPKIRSHKRLHVAKETFAKYLSEKRTALGEEYANWLIEFYNKIVQRLKVGIYEVDSAAEVGVIFEVMNNRGKDLTELEKVKNYLLYLTTKIDISTATELGVRINKTWTNIYERFMSANLGTESENQFLRAHWLFYVDYNRKEWDGSKSVKHHFNLKAFHGRHIEYLRQLNAYVSSLDEASIAFADLEKPERDGAFNSCVDADARRRIVFHSTKLLRTRTIASFRSVLMACRLRFSDDHLLYLDLVKLLEKFAFRVYNMEGKRADTGQSSILKAAYELYNGMRDYDQLIFHIRSLLHMYCPQERFSIFWNFDPLDNNWYYWSSLKYLLYEYEEYLADGDPLNVSWNYFGDKVLENSIEHILPQTSENADGYWARHFTSEEINIYTHDLGNLCLTFNNGSYRNFGFDRKKGTPGQADPCYANSSLNQERSLTEFVEWNVPSIQQRREKITAWALKRWYVDLNEFQINHIPAELVEDSSEDSVIS